MNCWNRKLKIRDNEILIEIVEIGEKSMKYLFTRHSIRRRFCNRRFNLSNTFTIDQLLPKHKGYDFYIFNFKKLLISTMKYHLTPTSKAIIKRQKTSIGREVEKMEPSYTIGGM